MTNTYQTPLRLFREQGLDTVEIAARLGCSEATAANLLHREREAEGSHKPADYWRRGDRWANKGLIPFAGREP